MPTRVLGATRQSRTRDRSISLDAQREAITKYEPNPVAITTDPSTSGAMSIFDRPGVGPWLTDELAGQWDVLVTTKLDRLFRDVADYLKARDWCAARGKRIVLLNQPELDETTPGGRLMASLLAVFAEFEREMIKERARERHAYLLSVGRWNGGRVPFGKKPEKRADGWYLVDDPDCSALTDMIAMAISGKSNQQISKRLNEKGITTEIGRAWRPATVGIILDREAKTDSDLADALATRRQPSRGEWTSGRHMLLNVAFCAVHETTLYGNQRGKRTPMYRCLGCNRSVAKAWLESFVETQLRARWGNQRHKVPHVIKGDDHAAELRRLERQLDTVKGIPGVDSSELERMIRALQDAPHVPDKTVYEETDETIAQHWDSLSESERGPWLRQQGVRVLVKWTEPPPTRPLVLMPPTWDAAASGWV